MSTAQTSVNKPRERGWFGRNWKWFLPTLVVLVIGLGAAGVFGVLYFTAAVKKSSVPYQTALEAVKASPQVIEKLGEPIEDVTRFPAGQILSSGRMKEADFRFQIAGPKGKAEVATRAREIEYQWGTTTLEVTFADDTRANLIREIKGNDDTPRFDPNVKPAAAPDGSAPPPDLQIEIPKPDFQIDIPKFDTPAPDIRIETPKFDIPDPAPAK